LYKTATIDRFYDTAAIDDRVHDTEYCHWKKSWVYQYETENKRHFMEYRHPGSPSVKKFKTVPSAKRSCSPFLEMQGT
jgi:hypothetical protein